MKQNFIILLLILLLFTTGCRVIKHNPSEKLDSKQTIKMDTEEIVGNDKDEYGCIGSAGYSWCEELQECIRPWETYCESLKSSYDTEQNRKPAIELATPYLITKPMYQENNGRLLKVEKVDYMRCIGCFSVYYNFIIDNKDNEVQEVNARVGINNLNPTIAEFTKGEIIIISKQECELNNGEVKQEDCGENETKIAMVSGYSASRICCIENE